MAFSFVDRIVSIETGRRAEGSLRVPEDGTPLPPGLAAEAVGQLAAWVAMDASGFRRRPVAGLAGEIAIGGEARPGVTVDLEAVIRDLDDDAVVWDGKASAGGVALVELRDCVGPTLPAGELDDPDATRQRFESLRAGAASSWLPEELEAARRVRSLDGEPGRRRRAELRVPGSGRFFAEHFPRKPVYPATLLLEAEILLARELGAAALGGEVVAERLRNVKLRRFLPPGAVLVLTAEVVATDRARAEILLTAEAEEHRVAAARVQVFRKAAP